MPLAVVPKHWTVRQLEAAIDVLGDLRSVSRIDADAFGERTVLAVAYDAMVTSGADSDFKLEPATTADLDRLAAEHGFLMLNDKDRDRLHGFARAVEELHGIKDNDIPF